MMRGFNVDPDRVDVPVEEMTYTNNTIAGKCSGCGDCCADLLPLSAEEVRRLKAYAEKHHLKAHTQKPFYMQGVDLTCPFRKQRESKCDVYEVRPHICRVFICSKTKEDARRDRNACHQRLKAYSLRYEIFGDSQCLDLLERTGYMDFIHRIEEALPNGR